MANSQQPIAIPRYCDEESGVLHNEALDYIIGEDFMCSTAEEKTEVAAEDRGNRLERED
jgi:hypothetical protein